MGGLNTATPTEKTPTPPTTQAPAMKGESMSNASLKHGNDDLAQDAGPKTKRKKA